jgi:hypothetical protein
MLLLRDLVTMSGVELVRHLQHPETNRMPRYQMCDDPCNKAAIDRVFDAASDTFGVRLKLDNPEGKLVARIDYRFVIGG